MVEARLRSILAQPAFAAGLQNDMAKRADLLAANFDRLSFADWARKHMPPLLVLQVRSVHRHPRRIQQIPYGLAQNKADVFFVGQFTAQLPGQPVQPVVLLPQALEFLAASGRRIAQQNNLRLFSGHEPAQQKSHVSQHQVREYQAQHVSKISIQARQPKSRVFAGGRPIMRAFCVLVLPKGFDWCLELHTVAGPRNWCLQTHRRNVHRGLYLKAVAIMNDRIAQ